MGTIMIKGILCFMLSSGSEPRTILLPRVCLAISGDFIFCHSWGGTTGI